MTTTALVPTGRVQVCCGKHIPSERGWCCGCGDGSDNCYPCCPECPTCVRGITCEAAHPGWRRQAAADEHRWQAEWNAYYHAPAWIAAAMWWFDRSNWARTVIHPQVPEIVRLSRAVERTTWNLVF